MAVARQTDLPGMENRKLADLHDAAFTYAEARDARVAATGPEVEAKTNLLTLMKKHKLEHYKFDNVQVDLVHEKENVKVKIKAQADPDLTVAELQSAPIPKPKRSHHKKKAN